MWSHVQLRIEHGPAIGLENVNIKVVFIGKT